LSCLNADAKVFGNKSKTAHNKVYAATPVKLVLVENKTK
jgi:hypothetical protein